MQDFASKFSGGGGGGEERDPSPPPSRAIYMALVLRTTKILEGLGKFIRLQAPWTSILKKLVSNPESGTNLTSITKTIIDHV